LIKQVGHVTIEKKKLGEGGAFPIFVGEIDDMDAVVAPNLFKN